MKKEEAELLVLNQGIKSPVYWLSCASKLLQLGFTLKELNQAIKRSGLNIDDLTSKEDFEGECHYNQKELIKDYHTSNYIRVYKDVIVEGQHIQMEGYKTGQVRTYRIIDRYQGLKHEKMIRALMEKRFKWFKSFKWDIYSLDYQEPEHYEIYLKTSMGSLYVPLIALLKKDFTMILLRMNSYYKEYRTSSSYDLNKKDKESLEEFKERKLKEYENDIKPLKSFQAKRLKKYLEK